MNELKPPMLKREDYKAIKHMNREDMTKYLYRVYRAASMLASSPPRAKSPSVPSYRPNRCRRRNKPWEEVCRTI